ncbi:ABC transporter permease [Paenibacillus tarimensis]
MEAGSFFNRRRFNQNKPLIVMFIPVIIYYVVFKFVPLGGSIIAFKDYNFADGILGSPWVGLDNFNYLFSNYQMIQVVRNTLMLSMLNVFIGFPFPIILAILLNEIRKKWFKSTVQTLVFIPHFLNWVIVGGLVVTVFSLETGIINRIIEGITGEPFPFLFNESSWIAIFVGSTIWKGAGFAAVIYLAALTTIDPSLYEAANMDGANKFRQIWHVTLPGIRTTIILIFIINIGHVMEVGFDQAYVLQNPVVKNVSEVIQTWNFKVGLGAGQFSYGAALGLFESVIGFILVITANRIARKFKQGLW